MSRGIIIAAPGSGSGKTTLTLALLKHLRNKGVAVASGKVGPDYIDPAYHTAASGRICHNLDTWSMSEATLGALVLDLQDGAEFIIVEGVMGLFDGAPDGRGSAADLSRRIGWPIVLVVDASGMAASAAALVHGFASYDRNVSVAGVIFNRVGSVSHGELLKRAMKSSGIPVFGCVLRSDALRLPDRHLGLVQASEHPDLSSFLDNAAAHIAHCVNTEALLAVGSEASDGRDDARIPVPILGSRIAVARDDAFAFCYPYVLDAWANAGCSIEFFSPLADESPSAAADAVYLPGGYPELHGVQLAAGQCFKLGLRACAQRGAQIYGECGGYMVLGRALIDREGHRHEMTGLLPLETSFAAPKLHLGYRQVVLAANCALGGAGTELRGHEFHFSCVVHEGPGGALFDTFNADGKSLGSAGLCCDNVMGSFIHLMDGVR